MSNQQQKKYICLCGSKIANNTSNIQQHLKTKKHLKMVKSVVEKPADKKWTTTTRTRISRRMRYIAGMPKVLADLIGEYTEPETFLNEDIKEQIDADLTTRVIYKTNNYYNWQAQLPNTKGVIKKVGGFLFFESLFRYVVNTHFSQFTPKKRILTAICLYTHNFLVEYKKKCGFTGSPKLLIFLHEQGIHNRKSEFVACGVDECLVKIKMK